MFWPEFLDDCLGDDLVELPGLLAHGLDEPVWEEGAVTPGVSERHREGEGGVGHSQGPVRGAATRNVQDARDAANLG